MLNEPGVDLSQVFRSMIEPGMAQDAYERGDYAQAARSYQAAAQATRQGEDSAVYYGLAARCWVRCKKKDRAVRALKMADRIALAWDGLPAAIVFDLGLSGDGGLIQGFMRGPSVMPRDEEKRLAYEVLMEAGHHDFGPRATVNLAALAYQQGDVATTEKLLEQARNGTSSAARVQAAYHLGALAEERGERARARRYYWRAAWSRGDKESSRRARRKLFARG